MKIPLLFLINNEKINILLIRKNLNINISYNFLNFIFILINIFNNILKYNFNLLIFLKKFFY